MLAGPLIAGLLHDIGKIILPDYVFEDHIITSEDEKDVIRQHPGYTKVILENKGFDPDIINAAYLHHERVDGSGYPSGLKAYEIPPTAKILSIVDSFSAITEDRPYREGQSLKRAVEILLDEKELFDVSMLSSFIKNINQVVHAASFEMVFYKHRLLKKVD
jgi:HD-GYP domain-containing protein (c-di-GMP phosphodiesterase class II)